MERRPSSSANTSFHAERMRTVMNAAGSIDIEKRMGLNHRPLDFIDDGRDIGYYGSIVKSGRAS